MNEPEQYQPTNTGERQETADAAPVSSSSDAAASSQPEYGQINQPEYGAMVASCRPVTIHTCMVRPNLNRNLRMLYSSGICNTKRGNTLQMGSNRCLRTMRTDNGTHTAPIRMGQIV